jgi:hypothetical protein
MSKESEQPKQVELQYEDGYVPLRLPGLITPFNVGDMLTIQSVNERHRKKPEKSPEEKK